MDSPISRRAVLAAGAALVVGAACGGDGGKKTQTKDTTNGGGAKGPDQLEVLLASAQLFAGSEQRITAGILQDAEPLERDTGVRFAFGRDFDRVGPFQPAEYHHEGIEDRPYYKATYTFDQPGQWVLVADYGGKKGATVLQVITAAQTKVPTVGQKLVPVKTPTTTDNAGVDPICTASPPCPFHSTSLDTALGGGKPLAVIFSTPALCQSRVCGPVLDVLVKESAPYRDKVQFVHVEVYKSMNVDFSSPDALSPGMRAYNLTFEPVLFLAGADGTIKERLDGPYDDVECREALQRLVA